MAGPQSQAMLTGIENLWICFDVLLDDIEAEGRWDDKHGEDWTFADVPYHMAYFDRELVAKAIERGTSVPREEQRTQRSMRELNQWNTDMFAQRPAGQTPQQSVAEYRAMRDRVRAAIDTVSDDRMGDPVWYPLIGCGFLPKAASIASCLAHTWSEFVQLRYIMGRDTPVPAPEATHGALSFLQQFMPAFMNSDAAKDATLVTVMDYTGPGGGSFTLRVADGGCTVDEGRASDAQLVISYSPETAELIRTNKIAFPEAMQNGLLQVEGMEHMETFGRLFPEPSLDTQFEPAGPGALD